MKNRLTLACVFLLGTTLVVGCGGVAPEDTEDSQTPLLVERDNPPTDAEQPAPAGGEEQVSSEEDRTVSDFAACCYVSCIDGAGDRWRGPFRSVKYGNCTAYARYYCGQHKWGFKGAKWDEC
jgi:hypothetical protein